MKSRFLIAAPSSNSGKTTLTLGLLRLLHNRGLTIQPFKCGPDYIDTKHHSAAAATPGINIDTFMMSGSHVQSLFSKYGASADVAIAEGVMGLFDGADRMKGSSAEIAMLLDLPVILVINAKAMAYSVAPLLYGFKYFKPALNIAGVIFNFVNSDRHYQFLKEACEDVGVEALGYVPVNDQVKIPSRHLGLSMTADVDYDGIALHIEKTVDIDRLLEITAGEITTQTVTNRYGGGKLKIAVARDEAFNFTYYENIETLQQQGTVTFFSPLHDNVLPEADLLYLAGGYPELYLETLSANTAMKQAILEYCNKGGRVIAECGGMMYLGRTITDQTGTAYEMVGFLDLGTSMEQAKLSLGYRTIELGDGSFKGHEFHYSTYKAFSDIPQIGKVTNAKGVEVNTPVYRQQNVLASYIHFYWGEEKVLP